ncbi:MAG: radical SAM protein [Filifactor alocis]|nr:radical SAM protein [Filifactor alocis]
MSILTTLSRMWLTRSLKPFVFTNEYDDSLPFEDCSSLGLYVHIPFCRSICAFCPYCKQVYDEALCKTYIEALLKEIRMVAGGMKEKKKVTSLYFGGGSPALIADRLGEIIELLKHYFIITEGIGVELHPEDIRDRTLSLLQEAGVNKLSIGIQSFQDKFLDTLGRPPLDIEGMRKTLGRYCFETVSMDFIFALPGQTADDLKADTDLAFSIGANHIAVYPFIDFTFTKNKVPAMRKEEKRRLLDEMSLYFKDRGYRRESIWTFSNAENANYSSMTRDNFLGFGCSATTLLRDQFKINTFSVEEYCRRISQDTLPTSLTLRFSLRQRMIYYLFWTAYSTEVDPKDFEDFFHIPLKKVYGLEFYLAEKLGFLEKEGSSYRMTLKGAFYYHHYENFYTLSYIDKMWGIMKDEAFPSGIRL